MSHPSPDGVSRDSRDNDAMLVDPPEAVSQPKQPTVYGCTVPADMNNQQTCTFFKEGMQGYVLEEKTTDTGLQYMINIRGFTGWWQNNVFHEFVWVSASLVAKGAAWKPNKQDWDVKVDLRETTLVIRGWRGNIAPNTKILYYRTNKWFREMS